MLDYLKSIAKEIYNYLTDGDENLDINLWIKNTYIFIKTKNNLFLLNLYI